MSTNPNNAVGTNAAYDGRTSVKAFNDGIGAYSRGILSGWACSPNTGMTVSLGGDGTTRDIAIAEDAGGNKITVNNISESPVSVSLSAAPVSNSRIDLIVAYVDNPPQGSATSIDNPGACGLIAVDGTAAADPVAPNDSAIRTAITADGASGATAYYVVLATITIASGTTDLTSDNIKAGYSATGGDVLWTNPNPTASFSAKTVTLANDLSNYKKIEVIIVVSNKDNSHVSTGAVSLGYKLQISIMTAGVPMWRVINITAASSGTAFEFGQAYYYPVYNSGESLTAVNNFAKPVKIIGYK